MSNSSLPEESEAQRIGHNADKCFNANCPDSWRVHSLDGTDDAGFDYQVQIVNGGKYRDIFRVQLKGTQAPQMSALGDFFSIVLKARTLNYYSRVSEPILLVLCDLSVDLKRPINCPLYYIWIHEEIQRHRDGNPGSDSQASLTIRVPRANLLEPDLDISSYIDMHRRMVMAAKSLDQTVEDKLPAVDSAARADILLRISDGFAKRDSALIEQMSAPVLTPWPEAPFETIAGKLKSIAENLAAGLSEFARKKLSEISTGLISATVAEKAEYWYLTGRRLSQDSLEDQATEAYKNAFALSSNSTRYKTAWVEAELRARFEGIGEADFSNIKKYLTSESSEEVALHARILAAEGLYIQAEEMLEKIPRKESLGTLAILKIMRSEWIAVIELCNEGLHLEGIKDDTKQLFYILRARSYFYLSMPNSSLHKNGGIIPVFGPVNLCLENLNSAWEDIEKTVELMSASGWSRNVGYFSDIWACTSMMLGKETATLNLMHVAARKRPREVGLQEALERIAMQCKEWAIALDANAAQPESGGQVLRRIILLYQAKNYSECVNLFEDNSSLLPRDDDKYLLCLSLAALAADEVIRPDVGKKVEELLQKEDGWEAEAAVIEYYRAVSRNPLARAEAVRVLADKYLTFGKPKVIGQQLFHALDAFDISDAEKCVEVALDLRAEQKLSVEAELHLAQAYTTLGKWEILLDLVDDAIRRFAHISRFQAIRAFALDKIGNSAEALEQLQVIVHDSEYDSVAINTYINIAARCGFSEDAISLVERLLGKEVQREKKFDLLRFLFCLVQMSDPQSQRSEEIAWRMGMHARQEIEHEEGVFILAYLTSTMPSSIKVTTARRNDFQERIKKFTERYPNSKFFRVGKISEDSTADDLKKFLRQMVGESIESENVKNKFANLLAKGSIGIPFSWRPRNVLNNVGDVAALWQITKSANRDARQYRLNMVVGEVKNLFRRDIESKIPLLDMITLFVIKDLKLFDVLFSVFPRIAVTQNTLLELQRLATPMVGSWARAQCQELIEILKFNIRKIIQPIPNKNKSRDLDLAGVEDIDGILSDQRFVLYSDDGVVRSYFSNESKCDMCTLDLLRIAEELKVLTSLEVSRKVGQLCLWNVDVNVSFKDLISVIPGEVESAKSVAEVIDIIQSDELASALFEGVWNVRKNYLEILKHLAVVLVILLNNPRNTVQTISGIAGVWYSSARLRTDIENISPLERLAQLTIFVAAHPEAHVINTLKRLFEVYMNLVCLEWGDRMDEIHEKKAIGRLAIMAATFDHEVKGRGNEQLGTLFMKIFTDGTADEECFSKAYGDRLLKLKIQLHNT
ncbi:DUF4365 domain-containing protein [Massilia sp. CFBP9026]|uniref:DUF4365 domain-containing protein n=1 Tax=Massilia sp. CFBP9026 TaxID=3096536 RepID=UPI002A6AD630|nr:DUF4365 domain-containing protein [Massilia sp. CFBP9026]MDY0961471.1 DUF4365 domain-containing protein [Massilia sp. CFBP9026]